jgi:hypothetical protein
MRSSPSIVEARSAFKVKYTYLIYMVKNPNPDNTSNPEVILQRVAVYFVLGLSYVTLIVLPYMAIRSSDEYMFLHRYYVST